MDLAQTLYLAGWVLIVAVVPAAAVGLALGILMHPGGRG
jgi:hypothetical protein